MKKNKTMRLASILLILTLLTTSVISGTFAKYTSSATATDTATVAKWSIKVDGEEIATKGAAPTVDIDLFKTVTEIGGGTDGEIATVEKLIAPGTEGSFALKIKNESQVDANYTITFSVTGANVPLKWKVNDEGEWQNSLTAINAKLIKLNTEDTVNIKWQWAFEGNAGDTELGIDAGSVTVTATIQVDQKD